MDILCSTLILFNKIEATDIRLLYYKGWKQIQWSEVCIFKAH